MNCYSNSILLYPGQWENKKEYCCVKNTFDCFCYISLYVNICVITNFWLRGSKHKKLTKMAISPDMLKGILDQQGQFQKSQQQLLPMMNQQFNHQLEIRQEGKNLNTTSVDNIANTITEFHYDTESGKTFASWYKRWTDIFQMNFHRKTNIGKSIY